MSPCRTLPVLALAALLHGPVHAQPGRGGFSAGVGMVASDSPYVGEGSRVRAFPLLGWEGEHAYLRGLEFGTRLAAGGATRVELAIAGRLDGVEADDLDAARLLANGVDRGRLRDRKDGVDALLRLGHRAGAVELTLEARHDLSGRSDGSELRAGLSRPFATAGWQLAPFVELRWLSSRSADYYYGVDADELAAGGSTYRPGSAVLPQFGLGAMRPLGERWRLFARLASTRLPDALADSPLLEASHETSVLLFLSRGF
jgi:MipA family protein